MRTYIKLHYDLNEEMMDFFLEVLYSLIFNVVSIIRTVFKNHLNFIF